MGDNQAITAQIGGNNTRTDYLTPRDLDNVLAALTDTNRLVCEVALHTGLRIGDVLSIKTEQLKPHFWVREAKTGKSKQVGLPEALLKRCKQQAGATFVFEHRTDPSKHRSRQAVWYDVKRAAKAFRLPQNVAPHSIRKVYAVELLHKYGDIERVRKALSHSSDSITLLYAMADKLASSKPRKRRGKRK